MKKLFLVLLLTCMSLSFVACGENVPDVQEVEKEESKTVTEDISVGAIATPEADKEEEQNAEEDSAETKQESAEEDSAETKQESAEESYANTNDIPVIDITNDYTETFTFTEFNKNEDGTPDETLSSMFECPTTVNCEIVDNGDGTKKVSYVAEFDIRDWSLEYDYYSSDTYMVDIKNGKIFSTKFAPNEVTVNGEVVSVEYSFDEEYDTDYTKHTKIFSIICPSDYEDYGMFLSDTKHINVESAYQSLDDILTAGSYEKRIILH